MPSGRGDLDDPKRAATALTSGELYLAVLDGAGAIDAPPATDRIDAEHGPRLGHEIGWHGGEVYAHVAVACAELGEGRYGPARLRRHVRRELVHRRVRAPRGQRRMPNPPNPAALTFSPTRVR